MLSLSQRLLRSTAATLLMAATPLAAHAASAAAPLAATPLELSRPSTTEAQSVLRLPAGHDELVFRGENASRHVQLYLSRGELDAARSFQIAFLNTVAALPDRSVITLAINGHVLATLPATSSNDLSTVAVAIPSGVLVPGFNDVDLNVVMSHRVDCSIAATYELWTLLDPSKTGFLVPGSANALRSLADLASEPLSEDGTTRIHVRLANAADTDTIGQAARVIDALVARVGLPRPVVDVGSGPGQGSGFDIVLSRAGGAEEALKSMRILSREDGITFARDATSGRLALIVAALDDLDLERQVDALVAKSASRATVAVGPTPIDGEMRRSFADLGQRSDSFAGRHYAKALEIALPSDFYPANYDKARLLIDGAYAADLEPDSNLVFRVNGTLVSSLRLGPDRSGVLQHEIVELPLRFFHPGTNVIGIEGTTRTFADRQCDPAVTASAVRLTIADTSELDFPRFAHLGTTPQLPGALASLYKPVQGSAINLYLADAEPAAISAGLTVLANMAASQGAMPTPNVRIGSPSGLDAPGIVVSPLASLPAVLAGPVRAKLAVDESAAGADGMPPARPTVPQDRPGSWSDIAQGRFDLQQFVAQGQRTLRNQGFFFGTDRVAETVPFSSGSLLIAAIDPRLDGNRVVGVDMPRFTSDPAQWIVVTAGTDAMLQVGTTRLVTNGQWKDLRGQAVSLNVDKGKLTAVQPSRVLYVVPKTLVLSDLRPILGGIVSNNIELSLAVLVALMTLLGLSTHALIRKAGPK